MISKPKKGKKKSHVDTWGAWGSLDPQPVVEDVPLVDAVSEPIIEDIPEAVHSSYEITARLRQLSPYTEAPVALHIGGEPTVYYVPSHLLPRGRIHTRGEDPVCLPDVDAETGHTLVHYLYRGTYETLHASGGLEKAILVYIMAKSYELPELVALVVGEIESLCAELDIFQMMASIEPNFTKLELESHEEGPVHTVLRKKARATFEADHTAFESNEFLVHLSNADFRSFMLKCVMKLYSDKVSHMEKYREEIKEELKESKSTAKEFKALWMAEAKRRMASRNDYIAVDADDDEHIMREDTEHVVPEPESLSNEGFSNISCPSCEEPVELSRSLDGLEELQPDGPQPEEVPFEEVYPEEPCPEVCSEEYPPIPEAYPEENSPPPEPYPEESSPPPEVYPEEEEPLAHEAPVETTAEPETTQDELTKILQKMGRDLRTHKAKRALKMLERALKSEKQAAEYETPQPPSTEEIVLFS
ncbi:hypothetical protein PTMSG1_00943 [Pyrenophora teres f. maculata]|nr:hypothetical protein PTMSG1_00943 [Pyrenophora teres f. maculata]